MSMNGDAEVGNIHPIDLTVYRDGFTRPVVLWQENQCFKLTFDSPYKKSELYNPFTRTEALTPKCRVSTRLSVCHRNFTIFEFSNNNFKFKS